MPYLMRKLLIDELQLRETFRIINKYICSFDENEVSIPNFSHYHIPGEISIRLRVLYSSDAVVNKAVGLLDQLVQDGDINAYRPEDCWCYKDNVPIVDREYCILAFKCAFEFSELADFEDITENNRISQNFFTCFLDRLFQEVGINLNFRSGEIQRVIERDGIQDMITHSIEAVTQNVDFNYDDYTNPFFFKRFIHMLWNNLLVNQNGESRFRSLFYRRNRRNNESEEETLQRFCDELAAR